MESLLKVARSPHLVRDASFLDEVCRVCHVGAPAEADKRKTWCSALSQVANAAIKQLGSPSGGASTGLSESDAGRLAAACVALLVLHKLVELDCIGLLLDRLLAQAVSAMGSSHANMVSVCAMLCVICSAVVSF